MLLVADSGSSKTDWALVRDDSSPQMLFSSKGLNPVFTSSDQVFQEVHTTFHGKVRPEDVSALYFYGAGCWNDSLKQVIQEGLRRFFQEAAVEVEHDLLGAARATCEKTPGIACILGTGSNSCLYDGQKIVDNVPSLGYMLGDEGSGADLGKRLLRAYFYREFQPDLEEAMKRLLPGEKTELLQHLYQSENPNKYLASFSHFLRVHKSHETIQKILRESFIEFLVRHVKKYRGSDYLPVHFVGSICWHFQEVLREALSTVQLTPGVFIEKPIQALLAYHLEFVQAR